MNHTKEPWRESAKTNGVVADHHVGFNGADGAEDVEYYGGHLVAESMTKPNIARVVACVNALAGVKNPEAVKDLIEGVQEMISDKEIHPAARIWARNLISALSQEPS